MPNNQGDQPLHIACREQLVAMATLLVSYGANKDATNAQGETPESIVNRLDTPLKKGLEHALACQRLNGI